MVERTNDETAFEKILEAARAIETMAKLRPHEAPAMLERARYLCDIAEDIRRDIQRRYSVEAPTYFEARR